MFKLYIDKGVFLNLDGEALRGIDLVISNRRFATIYYDKKPKRMFKVEHE
jgi:hypothetical protein